MTDRREAIDGAPSEEASVLLAGLYVVATPIGHLSDISARAIDVLRNAAWVACEDTRVSRVLLDRIGARPRLIVAHQHNEARSAATIVEHLRAGAAVALISDGGTPAISDPGARIVAAVHEAGLPVIPVPGPAAVTAIVSAAGFGDGRFRFEGFLPPKPKARRERLGVLSRSDVPVVLYEAPHRIRDTLEDLAATLPPARGVVLGRELTKRFEEIRRLRASELIAWLDADPNRERGEYVLAIDADPNAAEVAADDADVDRWLQALCEAMPPREAARIAARVTGRRANEMYARAAALRGGGDDR
jgi:16S rRNA (cytidine1402-2'-O)-methyltransferase